MIRDKCGVALKNVILFQAVFRRWTMKSNEVLEREHLLLKRGNQPEQNFLLVSVENPCKFKKIKV